jgi:hypothetical protein
MVDPVEPKALLQQVRWQITDLLGDRVASVQVELMDHDSEIGIAICTASGWRHGVRGPVFAVRENPDGWTIAAHNTLVAWIDAKEAAASK